MLVRKLRVRSDIPIIVLTGREGIDDKLACFQVGADDYLTTPAEFSLVWALARADGNVLARKDIVDAISPGDGPISTRAVNILVSRIRKKVGKDVILTVTNAGYKCGRPVSDGG